MPKITKEKRIEKRLNELKEIYQGLPQNKWVLVYPAIQNCAFMECTLDDLQKEINLDGAVSTYQNGANQHGDKPSGAVSSYNTTLRNYNSLIKTLDSFLPASSSKSKLDAFLDSDE